MADSIVDNVFSQPKQNAGAGITGVVQGNQQGIDAGLALAHGQQQSALIGQQLEDMKNQATIQKGAYAMSLMDKIQQTQNPKVRGLYLDNYNDFATKNGQPPLSESNYDYIKNVPDSNVILSRLVQQYPHVSSDPTQAVQFVAGFAQAMGMPLADAEKAITPLLQAGNNAMLKNMMLLNQTRKLDQGDQRINIQQNKTAMDQQSKMEKDIDPDAQPATTPFGKAAQIRGMATRLDQLKEQNPDLNFAPNQMVELASGAATIFTNGSRVAQEQINHFLPSTVGTKQANIEQWLSNDPQGAQQQGFVKQLFNTIDRESDIANKTIRAAQINKLSGHSAFKASYPDAYESVKSKYMDNPSTPQNTQLPATQVAPTPQQATSPALQNPQAINLFKQLKGTGKSYNQLSPVQQKSISEKDYNSL